MGLRFSSYDDQQCELNGQYQKKQFNLAFIISWPKKCCSKLLVKNILNKISNAKINPF